MEVAEENGCKSVSFPAISCGVYGYPIPEAAGIAVGTVNAFLGSRDSAGSLELVRFVLFSREIFREFEKALRGL
jgi:O-acetyl-ADP-ribose deacetylase (regulator of RNase III)